MLSVTRPLVTFALILALPTAAFGWGKDGHEVVGKVADKFLEPPARKAVDELLKDDQFKSIGDPRLASWADFIRGSAELKRKYPNNDKFHYLDFDIEAELDTLDVPKGCLAPDYAPDALARFRKVLRDPAAGVQEKREALFFVVHIVGDIHQPLHCAERTKDKGGNLAKVKLPGQTDTTNLHKVWDTDAVAKALGPLTPTDYAAKLIDGLSAEDKAAYAKGIVADWVLDSHKVARAAVYPGVPKTAQTGEPAPLSAEYLDAAAKAVKPQLAKGGVRLAAFLNETFKP